MLFYISACTFTQSFKRWYKHQHLIKFVSLAIVHSFLQAECSLAAVSEQNHVIALLCLGFRSHGCSRQGCSRIEKPDPDGLDAVEVAGSGPGVGAHFWEAHKVTNAEFGQRGVAADDISAVTCRAEQRGGASAARPCADTTLIDGGGGHAQGHRPRHKMIIQDAIEGSIQACNSLQQSKDTIHVHAQGLQSTISLVQPA